MEGTMTRAIQGTRVLRGVVVALFLTAVLPLLGARWLNGYRVDQTAARTIEAASILRERMAQPLVTDPAVAVACGPGRMPDMGPTGRWVARAVQVPQLFGDREIEDGWGQCLLVNAADWAGHGPLWVLSAGPNGIVETYPDASAVAGDDIGARVR